MAKVSVIVPVYNVERYIERCLTSLYGQTMQDIQDIEVILVDDLGMDRSMDIVHHFIDCHQLAGHWHIITATINQGPGAARNIGIRYATGEYIAFVDSDDWIEPDMLQALYTAARRYDADISSSAAILDYPDGTHRLMTNPHIGSGTISVQARKYLLRHFVSNFTTMLFRREWLVSNNLYFPEANSGEDSCFMAQCYLLARSIAQTDTPYYHYIIHPQSISHRKRVYRGREKRKAFGALLQFARERNMMGTYGCVLRYVYFKKAILSSILDYIRTL